MRFIKALFVLILCFVLAFVAYSAHRIKQMPKDHELISQVDDSLIYRMPRVELVYEDRSQPWSDR